MPASNADQLLAMINQASFAMDDILLYLDTHPCDQAALNYYQYVTKLRREALEAYEATYGPLLVDHVQSSQYWTWVQGKWPWEGGNTVCGTMKNGCNIQ